MKKILVAFLGLALAAACQLSYAAAAVVTAVTGTVQATGSGAARTLRVGDTLDEGDTVVTLGGSSALFRFEDGHIAAPHANTRFVVTAYKFNRAQPAQNNVFLSLVTGTMRTITGLIGKAQPQSVAYRAGTATIGIRGTDILLNVSSDGTRTVLSVTTGEISITTTSPTGTPTTTILTTGNASIIVGQQITQGTLNDILARLPPEQRAQVNAIINDDALNAAVNQASTTNQTGNPGSTPGSTSPN